MTDSCLRQMFAYQAPDLDQAKRCVALRTSFYNLAKLLVANTPAGRAQALAVTALQQAAWAALAAVVDGNDPAEK